MFSEVIELLIPTESVDIAGDTIITYVKREVFARLDRIYLSEAIEGAAKGFKPEQKFTISDYYDYQGEEELLYEGIKYQILNTQRKGTTLEVTCYGGVPYGKT